MDKNEEKKEKPPLGKNLGDMTPEESAEYFKDALDLWGTKFCREFIRSCNQLVDKDGNPIPPEEVDESHDVPSDIIDE